jgi:hypothetical protein
MEYQKGRVEHRRSKFRLRTFRFQPFRLLVPKTSNHAPVSYAPSKIPYGGFSLSTASSLNLSTIAFSLSQRD